MGSTVLARNIAAALGFVIFGLIATNTLWQINPHPNPADSCATIRINEFLILRVVLTLGKGQWVCDCLQFEGLTRRGNPV